MDFVYIKGHILNKKDISHICIIPGILPHHEEYSIVIQTVSDPDRRHIIFENIKEEVAEKRMRVIFRIVNGAVSGLEEDVFKD